MSTTASKIVTLAQSWVGKNEKDGTHKEIIDIYNSHKPLARGYKVKYTDSWCATFISALAIKCKATNIIPTECGCGEMVELFKKLGVWVESEAYTPKAGDIIFYDWQGGNGWPDHVGIVEKVANGAITVIEGNHDNAVKRRTISTNQKYIRGYACPKYEREAQASVNTSSKGGKTVKIELDVLKKGSKGEQVKTLQSLLLVKGFEVGVAGIDGDFGNATNNAVMQYQKSEKIEVDGIVGFDTWSRLLK